MRKMLTNNNSTLNLQMINTLKKIRILMLGLQPVSFFRQFFFQNFSLLLLYLAFWLVYSAVWTNCNKTEKARWVLWLFFLLPNCDLRYSIWLLSHISALWAQVCHRKSCYETFRSISQFRLLFVLKKYLQRVKYRSQ